MYQDVLTQIGLSYKEALVYEALLELGEAKASKIANKTGLKRSNTYDVLYALEKKGLISQSIKRNKTYFQIESPDKLKEFLEKQEKELEKNKKNLDNILPTLKSAYNLVVFRPTIKFYEGKDGIKLVAKDSLTSKTIIYSYLDPEAIARFIQKINIEYVKQREKKKIFKKILTVDSPYARNHFKKINPRITAVKLMDKEIPPFQTVMQIYDNKISYITLTEKKMIGVIIEDKNIYTMHKYLFEYNWRKANPIP